jgi:hypothetical protein
MSGREVEERDRGAGRAQHGIADGLLERLSHVEEVVLLVREGTWLKVEGVGVVESRRGIFTIHDLDADVLVVEKGMSSRYGSKGKLRKSEENEEGKGISM